MDIQQIIHDYLSPINQIKSANALLKMEHILFTDKMKCHQIIEEATEKLISKTDQLYINKLSTTND